MLSVHVLDSIGADGLDVTEFTTAAGALLRGAQAIPAAFRDKPAPVEVRREAYLRFQNAFCRATALANLLPDTAKLMDRPIIFGGPWNYAAQMQAVLWQANEILGELLAAMAQLRLVGGPGPNEAMRRAANAVGDAMDILPVAKRKQERAAQLREFAVRQKAASDAINEFTEACRIDLAYRRKPRAHWWQIWARKVSPSPDQVAHE